MNLILSDGGVPYKIGTYWHVNLKQRSPSIPLHNSKFQFIREPRAEPNYLELCRNDYHEHVADGRCECRRRVECCRHHSSGECHSREIRKHRVFEIPYFFLGHDIEFDPMERWKCDRIQAGGGAKRNPCLLCQQQIKPRRGDRNSVGPSALFFLLHP